MDHRRWRLGLLLAALAFALGSAACSSAPATDTSALQQEVRAVSAEWDAAFNAADTSRLMGLYADNVVSMPFGRPEMNRAALEQDFAGFFADFATTHQTTIVGLEVAGDWSIERGHYTLHAEARDGSGAFDEVGKHIMVRHKTPQGWRVVWEIWNLDTPAE